jgi:hypothetical protein
VGPVQRSPPHHAARQLPLLLAQRANVVVVEIFENLACEPPVLEAIKTRLGKASRQLYDKWLG